MTCSKHRQKNHVPAEQGATLLVVIVVVTTAMLLIASLFSLLWRSLQAVQYEQQKTQALFNARMGVDAAIEFVKQDITNMMFTTGGFPQLAGAVNSDLAILPNPPFHASISVDSPTTQNNQTTLLVHINSSGFTAGRGTQGGSVSLNLTATLVQTATSGAGGSSGGGTSGGGTGTTPTSVSLTNVGYGIGSVSVTGTGSTPVNLLGDGSGGSIVVNGSSVTVTGFPNMQQVTGTHTGSIRGTAWLSGDGATTNGSVSGTAVVTGAGDNIQGQIKGSAIVTGSSAVINGNISGPALLMGGGDVVIGGTQCALITADNVTMNGPVHGDLIVTGNHDTIQGSVDGAVVVTGNNLNITGHIFNDNNDLVDASGHAYALYATGTGEIIGGKVYGDAIEYLSDVSAGGGILGTISAYSGQTVVMNSDCLGTVQLNFSTGSAGNITVNFSSATIGG